MYIIEMIKARISRTIFVSAPKDLGLPNGTFGCYSLCNPEWPENSLNVRGDLLDQI